MNLSGAELDRITEFLSRLTLAGPPQDIGGITDGLARLTLVDGANFEWPDDILRLIHRVHRINSATTIQRIFRSHMLSVLVQLPTDAVRFEEMPLRTVLPYLRSNPNARLMPYAAALRPEMSAAMSYLYHRLINHRRPPP